MNFFTYLTGTGVSKDIRVKSWFLVSSPVPSYVICLAYLLVIWTGQKFMRNRKSLHLKYVLVPYNFILVGLSTHMFFEFLVTANLLTRYSYGCQPVDYSLSSRALRMASAQWQFYMLKLVELLDTIFLVLRKKEEHITFQHMYHRCVMVISWRAVVAYAAGGQAFFVPMLNSGVHILVYSYYGMASVGPHMYIFLLWKKYVKHLQIIQLILIISHTVYNMTRRCDFPQEYNTGIILYAASLAVLFVFSKYREGNLGRKQMVS